MPFAGVGMNIVDIARVERIMARTPAFGRRVFTDHERRVCESMGRPSSHYAARLAARGAVLKALGCEPSLAIRPTDVSVGEDAKGRTVALLKGKPAEAALAAGVQEVALALSFTHDSAIANAVAVTPEVRPKEEKARDTRRELAESFRAARSILSEMEAAPAASTAPAVHVPQPAAAPQPAPAPQERP